MTAVLMENLGLLAEAPGGIRKLRGLILELATQGRLIETGSVWRQTQLRELVTSSGAGWSPSCENRPRAGAEWGVLKVSAVSWAQFNPDENKALPAHLEPRPELEVRPRDFLISRANTAELVARSVVVADTPPHLILSDKIVRLRLSGACDPRFIQLVNSAPKSRSYYARVAGGTSSSMKNVSREQILALPVLLPPLAEQHRIVAKVDELMALCDRLETRQSDAQAAHARLVDELLGSLLQARDAEDFAECWGRVKDNFDVLFTTEQSVELLKRTILGLGMTGGLSARGSVSKWEKIKVADAGHIKLGRQRSPKDHHGPNMVQYLRVANVLEAKIDTTDVKSMNFTPEEQKIFRLLPGDILLNEGQSKELVGRPAIFNDEIPGACFQNTLLRFRCYDRVTPSYALKYFLHCMYSGIFQKHAQQTTNIAHLSSGRLATIDFLLPPLEEQQRIIAKVDELMNSCDRLKASLAQSQHLIEILAAVLVKQATLQ